MPKAEEPSARRRTGPLSSHSDPRLIEMKRVLASKNTQDADANRDQGARHAKMGLEGDYWNVALLLFLYTLQGIPLGLSMSMDLILQEKKLSLAKQGVFNSVSWPYSLKIMWAPIVDSVFLTAFGRRKSWLVPCQMLIGLLMVLVPRHLDDLLTGEEDGSPQVYKLTALFFIFYLLAATQDIALDGWAVTMLARRNIGYASTCNAVGQTVGFFIAFTGLLAMQEYEICDLKSFMSVGGVIFLVSTMLVAIFKHEETEQERQEKDKLESQELLLDAEVQGENDQDGDIPVSVSEAYSQMVQVLRLDSVKWLLLVLATRGIAFASADSLAQRKLMQRGMKKEHLSFLTALVTPLGMILPGLISKQTSDRPLDLFKKAFLPRVAVGLLSLLLVVGAPDFQTLEQDHVPWPFMLALAFVVVLHTVLSTAMFVAIMAFFAQVSDPAIGGTYMTLLNTIANLGSKWPNQLVLFLVGYFDYRDYTTCDPEGENCELLIDGFVPISIGCIAYGIFWYNHFGLQMERLQSLPVSAWRISTGLNKK